jgi:hypothetical protein
MSSLSKFDIVLERVLERKVDEYFASLAELSRGPVFQVHAAMTKSGLTRAARKTKRSQLADMKVGQEYFFKAPKGVNVARWTDRWSSAIDSMQKKTGYRWSTHRDRENGGAVITRTR